MAVNLEGARIKTSRKKSLENETNILFNDTEESATIYTAQVHVIRDLRENPQATLIEQHFDEDGEVSGEEWSIFKQMVVIR